MRGKIGAVIVAFVLVVGIICGFKCVERIPTGYVGTIYSMNGGVTNETLSQGFHMVSPTKKIKLFSISNEQLILSKDSRDGSLGDDSFLVSTSDNANIAISFQMSYKFNPTTVIDTYKKFRGMDGEDVINLRVKTVLKAKISEITSKYTMMDIYSGNRGKINAEITNFLNEQLKKEYGVEVLDASIIDVHPDEQLQKSIQDRVTAMQNKQKAEAEQETAKVEAETKLIKAQNEADIKITQAEAEAKSNNLLSNSVTEQLIKMKEAEARLKHGWIEVQGGTAIVDNRK